MPGRLCKLHRTHQQVTAENCGATRFTCVLELMPRNAGCCETVHEDSNFRSLLQAKTCGAVTTNPLEQEGS